MTKSLTLELENYKDRVKLLDAKAEHLVEEKKIQYEAAKKQFLGRLEVWKQSVESDIVQLRNNIEEGYNELESKIL